MLIFLFFLLGIVLFHTFHFFPLTSGVIFVVLSALIIFGQGGAGRDFGRKPFLVVLLLSGFFYGFFRYSPPVDPSSLGREIVIDCATEEAPQELLSGRSVSEVKVGAAFDPDTGRSYPFLRGRVMNIISDGGLKGGFHYLVKVRTGRDMERLNPGAIQGDRLYGFLSEVMEFHPEMSNPVYLWFQEKRHGINREIKSAFDKDSSALLAAITTGERSTMSDEVKDAFNTTGLAHLLSISGTHFGLFATLTFGLFRLLIKCLPLRLLRRFTLYLSPSQGAALLSLPFICAYLLISGLDVPAIRSFIMIAIFLFGLLLGRRGFWLNSLLFAAFLICIWDPSAMLSVSFQLSFLAVLFIGIALGDKAEDRGSPDEGAGKQGYLGRVPGMLKNSMVLSLSASLGTAPLVAYYFHYFSIISPLSNLIITPFIGFVLVSLSLLSAFVFMLTGYYPLGPVIACVTEIGIKGVNYFASIPFADVKIPAFPLAAVIIFYSGVAVIFCKGPAPKRRYFLALTLAFLCIVIFPMIFRQNNLSVTFLDVGQGDSALIEGYGGRLIVIDTGRSGREMYSYLRYLGKRDIDALAITHADDDHSAGAPLLLKGFRVKELWDNGLLVYPEGMVKGSTLHRRLERGDEANAAGIDIKVLHPYRGFYTLNGGESAAENNDGLVLKVTGRNSFLFTADAAEEAEDDMDFLGRVLKSDVLKVGHHGSRTSSSMDFIRNVSPQIGVISVGRYNSYGHPHGETLSRLGASRVYRTDRDGAIKITEESPSGGGLSVKTYRDFAFEKTRSPGGEWRNLKRLFMRW